MAVPEWFFLLETLSNGDSYLQYTAIKPLIYSSSVKIPDKHDTGTTIIYYSTSIYLYKHYKY